jgi:cytochrome P450
LGGKPLAARLRWLPGFLEPLLTGLHGRVGADHAWLRRLMDRAFARVEVLRPRIEGIAFRLVDGFRANRDCDLVAG